LQLGWAHHQMAAIQAGVIQRHLISATVLRCVIGIQ
jgi:hypothetical protein